METLQNGLQLELTETAPCCITLKAVVPAAAAKKTYSDILTQYTSKTRQPGFRAGRVPQKLVLSLYGKDILSETARELVNSALEDALREKGLRVAGELSLADNKMPAYTAGEDFAFEASAEVFASIELPQYKGLELPKTVKAVSDEDVEKTIETIRRMHGKYEVVEREAQAGDMLKLNYTTDAADELKNDPAAKYQLTGTSTWQMLREPEMLPGITAALTGVKAGESRDAAIAFPADYRIAPLAGQTIQYHFEILEVHGFIPAEETPELYKEYGASNTDELKANLRKQMEMEAESAAVNAQMMKALDLLLEGQTFPVPPAMLAQDVANAVKNELDNARRQGKSEEDLNAMRPEAEVKAKADAEKNIRIIQILDGIAEAEKLEVNQYDIYQYCAMMAQRQGIPMEQITKALQKDRTALNSIMGNILRQKAVSFVVANAAKADAPEAPAAQ